MELLALEPRAWQVQRVACEWGPAEEPQRTGQELAGRLAASEVLCGLVHEEVGGLSKLPAALLMLACWAPALQQLLCPQLARCLPCLQLCLVLRLQPLGPVVPCLACRQVDVVRCDAVVVRRHPPQTPGALSGWAQGLDEVAADLPASSQLVKGCKLICSG